MIKARNLGKSFGLKEVLVGINFSIERGQKAALVAPNGTGKSTLLKILAGEEKHDYGTLDIHPDTKIGYFPQELRVSAKGKIIDYIFKTAGIEGEERKKIEYKAMIMLSGFGFKPGDEDRKIETLSSGQRSKVALIGILLKGADFLLLDEPTNNLDLPALIWLEDYLKTSKVAAIIVSHDRRFLDNTTQKVFAIDRQTRKMNVINGKYSHFLEAEEKRLAKLWDDYSRQQKELTRLRDVIEDKKERAEEGAKWVGTDNDSILRGYNRNKAGKSLRTAKVIEHRIDRIEVLDKPGERRIFNIPKYTIENEGNTEIDIKDLNSGHGKTFKIGPTTINIPFGKRICIIGQNGAGKSTLLKTIMGEIKPTSGTINFGGSARIVNMAQEHEILPLDKSPIKFLAESAKMSDSSAYTMLAKFDFPSEQANNKIETMSPGERARLILIYFAAKKANILILDEPTNHMDSEAVEALKEFLKFFTGTVVLVSHDRYFIEQIKLDFFYKLEEGILTKIADFQEYVKENDIKAKKLIRVISKV